MMIACFLAAAEKGNQRRRSLSVTGVDLRPKCPPDDFWLISRSRNVQSVPEASAHEREVGNARDTQTALRRPV